MNRIFRGAAAFLLSAALAVTMCLTGGAGARAVGEPRFADVPATHAQFAAIEFCAERGFINGVSATTFSPNSALTREQLALIWARTFHVKAPHTFSDVPRVAGGEAENAIIVMHALGFLNGVSATEYGRNMTLTREQAATVLARTYLPGVDGENQYTQFTDAAAISEYARNSISACIDKGLLIGAFTGEMLYPQNPVTRAELCRLIYNLMADEAEETPTPELPTAEPTIEPTEEPTEAPTELPTEEPTAEPTEEPTDEPAATPTEDDET